MRLVPRDIVRASAAIGRTYEQYKAGFEVSGLNAPLDTSGKVKQHGHHIVFKDSANATEGAPARRWR